MSTFLIVCAWIGFTIVALMVCIVWLLLAFAVISTASAYWRWKYYKNYSRPTNRHIFTYNRRIQKDGYVLNEPLSCAWNTKLKPTYLYHWADWIAH